MRQTHRRRAHGAVLAAAAAFLILLVGSAWAGASVHNLLAATKTPRPATINTSSKLAAATPKPAPTPTGAVLGAATPEPASQSQAQLQALVNAFAANQSAQFGIVVTDLKNNISASYQPDLQLPSASLYKLYVADVIYQTLDAGSLTYSSDSGYPGRTIEYCLSLMITISDNDCGDALGDITGWEKQNQQLQATGFRDTDMKIEPQTSAHDVALLLQLLYMNRLNSPDTNQRFLSLLKSQKVNNRLPQGLPSGTVIAHKTGDLDGFVHDAGIVYGPKTDYVVAVMSGPWPAPALAPASFVDLSRQLWDFFEK
jgi:beta-lactamase class A